MAKQAARYLREIAAAHSPYVIDLAANLIRKLYTRGYGEALDYDRERLREIYALTQRHHLVPHTRPIANLALSHPRNRQRFRHPKRPGSSNSADLLLTRCGRCPRPGLALTTRFQGAD